MARTEELRLMAKVAHLYYEQAQRQSHIAAHLDISQATVSRLLKRAEKEKIVRITVSMPNGVYPDLEAAIEERYGLKEVIIADCAQNEDSQILRAVGSAAAFYLETTIKSNEIIGISSWSSTLLEVVNAMRSLNSQQNAQVVQILGGVGNPSAEIHATHLTQRLANLVHGTAFFLPTPGVVGSDEARRVLLNDQFVMPTIELFDQVTLALVGIGALEPSKLLAESGNIFSEEELGELRQAKAVGDICLRFFDRDGEPTITRHDERVIGMSLEQLQKVERTVGVAGGKRKLAAIHGALKGGLVNVLITDRFTAESLLRN
jgi:DNA-binding transcriptional regulator LsrR (DeoR family)